MSKRLTIEEFIEKANQLHSNKYDYLKSIYVNSRSKIIIICPYHGEFEQRVSSHLLGNGCPQCAKIWTDEHRSNLQKSSRKSRGMTTEDWIEKAKKVHGDKYDYSQTVYVNQRTNVKIICPEHGLFEQNPDAHIRGCGCKPCGYARLVNVDHTWSDEQREKIAKTCLEKYGTTRYLDSVEGKEKVDKIRATREFREKMRDIISSDEVQQKTKSTCMSKYGVTSAMKLSDTIDKVGNSKRINRTWSTSKPEEDMYTLLCEKFGEDDVARQYKEVRYPFHCDFYIKSLDLFIELNATWLHGGHWFDEYDENDLKKLDEFKSKIKLGKRFYNVAIDVWTVRDVKKRQIAIDNHLNYVVFWNNDLSDFRKWIESDSLLLNNVLN